MDTRHEIATICFDEEGYFIDDISRIFDDLLNKIVDLQMEVDRLKNDSHPCTRLRDD